MPLEQEGRSWGDNVLATQGAPDIASQPPEAR